MILSHSFFISHSHTVSFDLLGYRRTTLSGMHSQGCEHTTNSYCLLHHERLYHIWWFLFKIKCMIVNLLCELGSSWYTTMVGRKVTLKGLTAKLWALGAATVRTTEFVQGHTSRWGLAWSFTPPPKAAQIKTSFTSKSNVSFMLEVSTTSIWA